MIITVKLTGLRPDTQMEEIIQFLKQAEDDLQVLRLDVSGLKSGRDSFTDYTVNGCPKGFCFAIVQGTQSAVSKLSGYMLGNTPVEVTILSVTSQMPDSEYDPDPFSNLKGCAQPRGKTHNDRLRTDAEKIKAFFSKTNQASSKFFQDMSHKMKPAMEKIGDAFKNMGKRK
ncbi:Hypothetical protein GLP15_2511 [Giardia lamblia P15]|uniref:Uncharacterized protein n=1 Tax=Giardia intestinalis (strain P15) TaxID=658858 RepID=E1EXA7_GIAIA|nr:Hypothetical protein GLP15_2511 [Giardia lamblia P15]